jgi:hypothetical protein
MALTIDLSYNTKDTLKQNLGLINKQYNTIYYNIKIKMSTHGLFRQLLYSLISKAQIQ